MREVEDWAWSGAAGGWLLANASVDGNWCLIRHPYDRAETAGM